MARTVGAQRLERALANERLAQSQPAWHIFHLDEVKAVEASEIMDRDDVRMDQIRGCPRLGPELVANSRLFDVKGRVHDLESAVAPEPEMPRFVDPGHRAATDE